MSQRDWDDAHVIDVIHQIHEDDATLGYRFIADELADGCIVASENRVWRLCSTAGIFVSHHRRRGKSSKPGPAVHDDLLASVEEKGRVTHDFVGAASGPNRVDTALIAAVLGEAVTMADAKTVKTVTGSSIGGVPPVGHPEPIRTIMDETLLALPVVWAAAASQNSVFDIEPQRLADATNATIARVS